ncbi:MAG: hypothetical protein XD90_1906 [Methanobacterium sp. 42_16]|nr:MAG: hypothetical protein XD90_1906 [Methanobacterium sp. 42_16]
MFVLVRLYVMIILHHFLVFLFLGTKNFILPSVSHVNFFNLSKKKIVNQKNCEILEKI